MSTHVARARTKKQQTIQSYFTHAVR